MKNRTREICTSGTVRDEGGNILIYSANDREDRGNVGIIRSPIRASILPDYLGHVWTAPWQELYVPAGSAFRPDHNEPCGSLSVSQHEIQRGRMHFHVAVVLCGDHQTRERTVLSGVPITAGPARPWQRDCRAWPVAPELVSPPGATLTTAAKLLAKDDRRHRIGWRGAGGRRRCACQQHGRGQVLVSFCVFMRALHFWNDRPPRNTALRRFR